MTQLEQVLAAILHFTRTKDYFTANKIFNRLGRKIPMNSVSTYLKDFYLAATDADYEIDKNVSTGIGKRHNTYMANEEDFTDHNPATLKEMIYNFKKSHIKTPPPTNFPAAPIKNQPAPTKAKESPKRLEAKLTDGDITTICVAQVINGKLTLVATLTTKDPDGTINTHSTKKQTK